MTRTSYRFMSPDEQADAEAMRAREFLNNKRYRAQRGRLFALLDEAVEFMDQAGFPDAYNGHVVGAFAQAAAQADTKSVGKLRDRKVAALDDPDRRRRLFELIGLLIAEQYLKERQDQLPAETRLSPPRKPDGLRAMLSRMTAFGEQVSQEDHYATEIAVRFPDDDPIASGEAMIEQAIADYETSIPEADAQAEVPDPVERKAIAKAALMRLHAEELEAEAAADGMLNLPTKHALANAIAEKYADDLEKVAAIVLRREKETTIYGLITRILPLRQAADLGAVERAFRGLEGRYIEGRIASFFIFGQVERSGDSLLIHGRVRAFTVNPAEAGGLANINAKPFNDNVTIRLQADTSWAEVNARRAVDIGIIRSVLRRTGEVNPSAAVTPPDALTTAPYSTWDPRSLWMLDFMRRDLRDPDFALDTVLMAHFLAPKAGEPEPEPDEDDGPRSRRPSLDAVRLFGYQLQEHPEACQRIVNKARLQDLELRIRNTYDRHHNLSKLIRFRLSWGDDHLAVLSGVTADGHSDEDLHNQMVHRVRNAATRQLEEQALQFTLRQIERRAAAGEVADDDPSVLDDENAEAS